MSLKKDGQLLTLLEERLMGGDFQRHPLEFLFFFEKCKHWSKRRLMGPCKKQ